MNIPLSRKKDSRSSMQSMNTRGGVAAQVMSSGAAAQVMSGGVAAQALRNSSDELLRQLAERARSQRLRHQLERSQSTGPRRRQPGDGDDEGEAGAARTAGLRRPALTRAKTLLRTAP